MADKKFFKLIHRCHTCDIKKEIPLVKENMENKRYGSLWPFFVLPTLTCSICLDMVDTIIEEYIPDA